MSNPTKRADETQTAFTIRCIKAEAWDEGKWAAYSAERDGGDGSVVVNPYSHPESECGCYACIGSRPTRPGSWITVGMSRMIVCSECGNKRCPHGTDHRNACTASNEPGQDGSRYSHELRALTTPADQGDNAAGGGS